MRRLRARLSYHFFGLLAALCSTQADRCHQARAEKQAQRFRLLRLRCMCRQAAALKGTV